MTHRVGLQRIEAAEILKAIGLVREGRVYDMGAELSNDMPQGPEEIFGRFRLSQYRTPRALTDPQYAEFDFSMDFIMGSPHSSTHIDAFTHVQHMGRIFGGLPILDTYSDFGWKAHGMETTPPIVGRGVLLDVAAAQEVPQLPDLFEITPRLLEETMAKQGVDIQKGDIILIRTGKFREFRDRRDSYFGLQPGVDEEGAIWLYEHGASLIGSDTTSVETNNPGKDMAHTTHRAMLVERGVHLIETMDLEAIAADRRYEFMFVCLPLKIVGGTGSWVRPIGIV